MTQSPLCFINYRRSDTGGHAARIKDKLELWHDSNHLFYDNQTVDYGADFPQEIEQAIERANVLLAVIGPNWLAALREYQAANKSDWVKREILAALFRGRYGKSLPIIPILVDGATMPKVDDLPAELADFALLHGKNAQSLGSDTEAFDKQFPTLLGLLEQHGLPTRRFRPPNGNARPFHTLGRVPSVNFHDPLAHLQHLRHVLSRAGTAAVLAGALHGMGGVGKTQLALKYSHAFQESYAGVWWLRAEDPVMLELDCLAMAEANHVPYEKGKPIAPAIQRWLATQPTWLLVYDNAEDMAVVSPYLPNRGQHHVLITSRRPDWQRLTGATACIHLEHWTPEQAVGFLAKRLPQESPDALLQIAIALGGLPLALEQAAAYIDVNGVSAAEYAQLLADSAEQATLLDKTEDVDEKTVLKTLSLALSKLPGVARQLLNLCAACAPEPIPESLFREQKYFLPMDVHPFCSGLNWVEIVTQLRRYSLVERDAEQRSITLHRLTQAAIRLSNPDASKESIRLIRMMNAAFPKNPDQPATWPSCTILLPHVKNMLALNDLLDSEMEVKCCLLGATGRYLVEGPALLAEAQQMYAVALDGIASHYNDEHAYALDYRNALANIQFTQGKLNEARTSLEQVLEIRQRLFGLEEIKTLLTLTTLGSVIRELGDFHTAEQLQRKAHQISQKTLGNKHPDTLSIQYSLAATLRDRGDLKGAQALQEQLIEEHSQKFEVDELGALDEMVQYSGTLIQQGNYSTAKEKLEKILATYQRLLGVEHLKSINCMAMLATIYRAQGKFVDAGNLLTKMLDVSKRVFGPEHLQTLSAMNTLAITLLDQGRFTEAKQLQVDILKICQVNFGNDHPDTLASMNNLGSTYMHLNDFPSATMLLRDAMHINQRKLGVDHSSTLSCMNNLAHSLHAQGDFAGAKAMQEQILLTRKRVLGHNHPETIVAMNNLAATLKKLGDLAGAAQLSTTALERCNHNLGLQHPLTTVTAWGLVVILEKMRNLRTAKGIVESNLLWLLQCQPHALSVEQKNIRAMVDDLVNH